MKTSKLAYRNFKGNFYRYAMYALSNAFAVTAFFIFANFVFHPEFDPKNLGGHEIAAMGAISGMIASQIIIVMFSILFVGYSTSIFLKSRGKEFGLLSLYGMTKKQIRSYVAKENTLLSLFSVVVGIVVGGIFSKLFLLIMENLLELDLAFNIAAKAVGLTFVVFFLLFQLTSYIMLFRIRDKEIVEEIKTSKIPKVLPKFSRVKALIGLVILILAYGVAWFVDGVLVPLAMVPVTILTIIGSYFLFTQFSIYLAARLKESSKVKYNRIRLISSSQIIFKLKDTAKVMFLASILIAVSLTATETIVSFYTEIGRMNNLDTYEDLGIVRTGDYLDDEETILNVEDILKKHRLAIEDDFLVKLIRTDNLDYEEGNGAFQNPLAISLKDYNDILLKSGKEPLELGQGQGIYVHRNEQHNPHVLIGDYQPKFFKDHISLGAQDRTLDLKVEEEIFGAEINFFMLGGGDMFIVNDEDFLSLYDEDYKENQIKYNVYKFKDAREALAIKDDIMEENQHKDGITTHLRLNQLREVERQFATILFIAFFIAFLFFIASGSIIYFKLFNEIRQDKLEYDILAKIGMKEGDLKRVISRQLAILLFIPFLVGMVHSLFALKSLSNLLRMNLIKNGILVGLGFLVFQLVYFLIIKNIYMKKLKEY